MLLVWEPAFENCCFRALPWALQGCLSNTVLSAGNVPKQTLILFGFGPSPLQLPSIPIHFSTPPTFLLPHTPLKVFLLKSKMINLLPNLMDVDITPWVSQRPCPQLGVPKWNTPSASHSLHLVFQPAPLLELPSFWKQCCSYFSATPCSSDVISSPTLSTP